MKIDIETLRDAIKAGDDIGYVVDWSLGQFGIIIRITNWRKSSGRSVTYEEIAHCKSNILITRLNEAVSELRNS